MKSTLLIFPFLFHLISTRTLTDLVCRINPAKCDLEERRILQRTRSKSHSFSASSSSSSFGGPSTAEFQRWNSYEETAKGTGFLVPVSGNNPVPYGPGLGDINIFTGVGVQHPYGGIGIQRDFGIAMGGNGRIGGIPVGWGNGGTRLVGSAPWANP